MTLPNVLNLKKVWRGEASVRQVFFVWGILGNLFWQIIMFVSNAVSTSLFFPRKKTKLYLPGEVPPEAVGMIHKTRPTSFWRLDRGDIFEIHLLSVILFLAITLVFLFRNQDSLKHFYIPVQVLFGLIAVAVWTYHYAAMMFFSGFKM